MVFSPKEMYQHDVVFSLSTDVQCINDSFGPDCEVVHQLCWEYPIVGRPKVQLAQRSSAPEISSYAKQQIERILVVHLRTSLEHSNAMVMRSQGKVGQPLCVVSTGG